MCLKFRNRLMKGFHYATVFIMHRSNQLVREYATCEGTKKERTLQHQNMK